MLNTSMKTNDREFRIYLGSQTLPNTNITPLKNTFKKRI